MRRRHLQERLRHPRVVLPLGDAKHRQRLLAQRQGVFEHSLRRAGLREGLDGVRVPRMILSEGVRGELKDPRGLCVVPVGPSRRSELHEPGPRLPVRGQRGILRPEAPLVGFLRGTTERILSTVAWLAVAPRDRLTPLRDGLHAGCAVANGQQPNREGPIAAPFTFCQAAPIRLKRFFIGWAEADSRRPHELNGRSKPRIPSRI